MFYRHFEDYCSKNSAVIWRSEFLDHSKFLIALLKLRVQRRKVLLVNGSPYGHVVLKLGLWFLGFKIIEYTPFPELPEIADKWHHKYIGLFNRYIIHKRILIDEWQLEYSSVKDTYVIKNYV